MNASDIRRGMQTRLDMEGLTEVQMGEYSTIIAIVVQRYELNANGDLVYRRNVCGDDKIRDYLLKLPDFPYSPAVVNAALAWLRSHASIIYNEFILVEENRQADLDGWKRTYFQRIIEPQWTSADALAWQGIKYCVKYDQTLILAPTGRGQEYKVLGTDAREVYKMLSTIDFKGTSRLDYMRRTIITPLEDILYNTSGPIPESAVIPERLSGAIAETIYKTSSVFVESAHVGYRFTADKKPILLEYVTKAIEVFLSRPEYRIKDIAPISNAPEVPTFCYIDIAMEDENETKEELYSRIPAYISFASIFEDLKYSWPVFCAYAASIVVAQNNGKQALWIHGHGDDAKSKMIDAFQWHLGDAATPIDVESMSNQFGMSRLEGKRLVTISDNKNPDFIRKGWFHKASGGDVFDCERKNKNPYKAKSIAKFIICENIAPNINLDERNQTSRLIYIKMRKRTVAEELKMGIRKQFSDGSTAFIGSSTFGQELIDQWPDFIKYSMFHYKALCETHSNIAVPTAMTQKVEDSCGDPLDQMLLDYVESMIEKSETGSLNKLDFMERIGEKYGDNWVKNGFNLAKVKNIMANIYQAAEFRNKDGRFYRGVVFKKNSLTEKTGIRQISQTKQPSASEMYDLIRAHKSPDGMYWED